MLIALGCGNPEPTPARAPKPAAPAIVAKPCERGAFRYALAAGSFEPTQDLTTAQLIQRWRAGAIAADAEAEARLSPVLGKRGAGTPTWKLVPAHLLEPSASVITIDGHHPLTSDAGPLVVSVCGKPNIDPSRMTTLVMSGTTALTGRTAERIDDTGVDDTIKYIKPFFASADLVHVSNEVSFVKGCKPTTGQEKGALKFCARDSYIELLAQLNTKLVELTGSHLTDYGDRAFARTIEMYAQRDWLWFGGGRTQIEATAPRFVEHHGNKFAFVGCNAVNAWVRHLSQGLGTASCDWARMKWQIQDLRRQGYLVVATVQHRELRTHAPPPDLVNDLRGLAEAGAFFVLGSQAHCAHPWDVHFGAYVHYGPGNILFAQHRPMQLDASVDKLYVYDGKLLSVAHMFVRTEHGQPRTMDDDERTTFLGLLAEAASEIEPPQPAASPVLPPITRERPDSIVIRGRNQYLHVVAPTELKPDARYPLVVDLEGNAQPSENAFYVTPLGTPWHTERATGEQIADFMVAKYPVDGSQLNVRGEPTPKQKHRHHHHHHHQRSR
jgi:hypothetical protein